MSFVCGVCNQQCVASDVKCSGGCDRFFHANCVKEDLETKKTRSTWKCKECRGSSKTSGSGTTSGTTLTKELLIRVIEDFKREVFEEMKGSRKEMAEMTTSLQFLSDKVDASTIIMDGIKAELAAVRKDNEELRTSNSALQSEVNDLKTKVRSLEQYSRINNLEFNDVPVTQGEDIKKIVKDIGKALNVDLRDEHIEAAHRVPSYNKTRTPSLIVRFQSRTTRDALLSMYRQKKTLDAKEVNKAYPSRRIYVNEHLSPDNKQFLATLKKRCRDKNYAFAWSRDGKFFAKKAQGESTKRIDNFQDIQNIN